MHVKEYETSLYFQLKYAKITQYEQQRYLELMKKTNGGAECIAV